MEFYINHTLQEIARLPSDEWEEQDDIERTIVNLDIEDEFFAMVKLIDDYSYEINVQDRLLFMKDIDQVRKIGEQYDAMLKESDDDSKSTDSWPGWDEPGASFDC
jgi:hypothetical protein